MRDQPANVEATTHREIEQEPGNGALAPVRVDVSPSVYCAARAPMKAIFASANHTADGESSDSGTG